MVVSELNVRKKEREDKAARKKAWSNRKRLPKRDPINSEMYNLLMKESEGPSYIATRTRIAICLLTVTGIRIGKLLPLRSKAFMKNGKKLGGKEVVLEHISWSKALKNTFNTDYLRQCLMQKIFKTHFGIME
jgi:hypothetical protein